MANNDAINNAIRQFMRLPGIGEKSATRLVYWLLRSDKRVAANLALALSGLSDGVYECEVCCTWSVKKRCAICEVTERAGEVLCVVQDPQDVAAFERSKGYMGQYHVLHGALSPLDGVSPADLRIRQLLNRLRTEEIKEVILATNPTVEGDATALYLARLLEPLGLLVTRLAHGISVGSEIEYADPASLARALENRQAVRS